MHPTRSFSSELLGPEGAALFAWSPSGDLLAAASYRRSKVIIFDRSGEVAASVTVPDPEFLYDESQETPVLELTWHPGGTHLAILPRGQSFAMVWGRAGQLARVDSGIKPAEVQAMAWCPTTLQLALGTVKGTGIIADLTARSATPLQLARSVKAVGCMAWSAAAAPGGLLALGCKGGLLVLCRAADGATVRSAQMRGAINQLQFCDPEPACGAGAPPPATATPAGCSLLAASLARRVLAVWQLPQALAAEGGGSGAFELAFREAYGEVEQFCWLSRRLLVAGFTSGTVAAVALSAGLQPGAGTGTEVFSARCLQQGVAALSWCAASGALAAGGGGKLATLSVALEGPSGPSVALQPGLTELEGSHRVASLGHSPDGRLLTAATASGKLLQLLARPPMLHGAHGGRLAVVDPAASLAEVQLLEVAELQPSGCAAAAAPRRTTVALPLPDVPEAVALGPAHLAAAHANRVWVQALAPSAATGVLPPPALLELPADIRWMALNAACLLLLGEGGRVFVQLGGPGGGGEVVELRGEDGEPFAAGAAALADGCILVGLPDGALASYRCSDAALLSEHQHSGGGITALFASHDGAMVVFQDEAGAAILFHTAAGQLMPLPEWAGEVRAAVWDIGDEGLVAAVDETGMARVYRHIPTSVQGPGVKLVGAHQGPRGAAPLTLLRGAVTWQLPDGSLDTHMLATHAHQREPEQAEQAPLPSRGAKRPPPSPLAGWGAPGGAPDGGAPPRLLPRAELLAARCREALALCHFDAALAAGRALGDPLVLRELAAAALQFFELRVAAAALEAAGDADAAEQLAPLLGEPDEQLVAGSIIAMTGGDLDRAEELLLASSRPAAAIEARRRAGHWDRAAELAERLEPHALGSLALLRAQALEAEGQVGAALALYRQSLAEPDLVTGGAAAAHARRAECEAGLARCSILAGDVEAGVELAVAAGSDELLLQCAELLDREQRPKEAGELYARAGDHERAARLFLSCREFALLDGAMQHAGGPELWLKYAQTKEDLGSFSDAASAYERAGDPVAAARVLLERLDDAAGAAALARRAGSAEACLAAARGCERRGALQLALELYCDAGACPAAFLLAQRNGLVPAFADWARRHAHAEAARLAATHYEVGRQPAAAAELAALAGQREHAARLYLQAGGEECIAAAAKLATDTKDAAVAAVVLQHLQANDASGTALLDLHLSLGNADGACEVAVARAQKEQAAGNYKVSRDQLLRVCLALAARGAPASAPLLAALHRMHAYLLVRQLVRQGDHPAAARLLVVVADAIHAFPKHTVPILTSAVVECHRAGLHAPAQRWAAVLVEQHGGQVSAAFAKKIEAIAKQPAWTTEGEAAEPQGDCLFCGVPGPETALACAACGRDLPFCAASAKRMLLADWSECPGCRFPCRGREMTHAASMERCCPLCEAAVEVHDVRRIFDPIAHLRKSVFGGLAPARR